MTKPTQHCRNGIRDLVRQRFQILEDGSFYVSAGVYTNCAGVAGIHVRISRNPERVFVFKFEGTPHSDIGEYGETVPAALVGKGYRDAIETGAREAYQAESPETGLTVVLIDAFLQ